MDYAFFKVHDLQVEEWQRIYAPMNVAGELEKMREWLTANPKRRKKNYQRFVINWLNKEHAKIQRQQIESRAYARVGTLDESRAATQHEANLRIIAELGG